MELDKAGRGSECDQGGGWLPEYRVLACVCVRQNMPGQVKKSLQKELHNKLMENRSMAGHRVCNKVDERLVHEVCAMSVMRFHPRDAACWFTHAFWK